MVRVPSPTPSPPSTPDYRRPASRDAHPSTTPAGPPPDRSFIASSTPAGPPPATDLFSSQFQTSFNPRAFNLNKTGPNGSPPKSVLFGVGEGSYGTSATGRPESHRGRFTSANNARIPSSPPGADMEEDDTEDGEDGEEDEDMGEHEDEEETGEDDEDMDEGEYDDEVDDEVEDLAQARGRPNNRMSQSFMSQNSVAPQLLGPPIVRPDAKQSQYDLLSLAKGLTPRPARVELREPDKIILETEQFMEKLHVATTEGPREKRSDALGEATQGLLAAWQSASQPSLLTSMSASLRSKGSSPLAQAHRLASLLLQIHHPRHVAQPQRPTALSLKSTRSDPRSYTPIPKVLLDWLNTHHNAISEVPAVMAEPDGCSAHRNFWDAILASAFLGDFGDTVKLLRRANFSVAETASVDNPGASGYTGVHLDNAEWAAREAINLLEECPALSLDDWDVKGHDWSIFRQRVSQTLTKLQEFAEGESQNRLGLSQSFQTSHFGITQSQNSFNLSVASRKAESKVPWSVYDNLCRLYRQLLGNEEDLVEISADWIEAVIGLTVWWNGDEEDVPQGSLAASRRSIARSQRIRTVDVTPVKAYCQRLSSAMATMFESDEEEFSLNTTDRAAVGLACIFDGNVEGALQIISSWSLTVASSVAEVASGGDWFRQADSIMDQFDNGDLMLLSYNDARPAGATKDDLLIVYADALAKKATIRSPASKTEQEGWELAIRVLGRLDDDNLSKTKIEQVLNELSLEKPDRVDKITQLCYGMNLSEQAQHIALKFAEHLRHNTQNYGDTLLYYARAHDTAKIQEVLRVLVAHCLVKSIAYPPLADLDSSLKSLILSPKQTLTKLATFDPEGARMLSNHLSGYATIRKFYDLRDEEIHANDSPDNVKPAHRPMARKRAAANALVVIIQSAASCIRGGLYDADAENVVQVDVLLALLGEALIFVNQPKRTLTLRHLYTLLAAVEDIDTAPSMIRKQCEEVLTSTLAAAHEGSVASPREMLQKEMSGGMGGSGSFEMIRSTEFGSADGSGVLVGDGRVDGKRRGWDWRGGLSREANGGDVVRLLRLGIAREIARAFVGGEM